MLISLAPRALKAASLCVTRREAAFHGRAAPHRKRRGGYFPREFSRRNLSPLSSDGLSLGDYRSSVRDLAIKNPRGARYRARPEKYRTLD